MCASVCDGAFVCLFVHSMRILGTHLYRCVSVSVSVRLCVFLYTACIYWALTCIECVSVCDGAFVCLFYTAGYAASINSVDAL